MSVSPLEALMAAGGATATEMADILINKHRVSTDYASEEKKDIKNDPALFGANQPIAMIKVSKNLVPPSDYPTSTAALRNLGGASIVVHSRADECGRT